MNRIDRALQPGSGFRVALFVCSIIILVSYILAGTGNRGGAFAILLVGLAGTVREYHLFRRQKKKAGEGDQPVG